MLSADFGHLERDTQMVDRSAAEWVHILSLIHISSEICGSPCDLANP